MKTNTLAENFKSALVYLKKRKRDASTKLITTLFSVIYLLTCFNFNFYILFGNCDIWYCLAILLIAIDK